MGRTTVLFLVSSFVFRFCFCPSVAAEKTGRAPVQFFVSFCRDDYFCCSEDP